MATLRISMVWLVFCGAAVACTTDGGSDTSGGSTSVAATTSTQTSAAETSSSSGESSGSSSSEGSSSSSSGASSSSSGEPAPEGPPVCTRECELPSDCCGFNEPGCPSAVYPGNYGCVDGACIPPACRDDAECEAVFPGATCHRVFGHAQCVQLCEDASSCGSAEMACLGLTDDGQSFCRQSCVDGGAFACPTTTCDEASGLCLCEPGDCPTGETCAPL